MPHCLVRSGLAALVLPLMIAGHPLRAAEPVAPSTSGEIAAPMEAVDDLAEQASRTLGITREQARGGLGALFSYAQARLSEAEFAEMARAVENMDELLAAAPRKIEDDGGGLFSSEKPAAESDELRNAFTELGLSGGLIEPLIDSASQHLEASSPTAAALLKQTIGNGQ